MTGDAGHRRLADAVSPAFDASGKYLYFLASTDYGPRTGWLEMSQVDRPVRRAIYMAVLLASEPSPLLPEIGDEPAARARRADSTAATTRIDAAGHRPAHSQPIDVPAGDFSSLVAGPAGSFFYAEPMGHRAPRRIEPTKQVQIRGRTAAIFLEGFSSFQLSADRKKLLYQAGWRTLGSCGNDKPAKVGDGPLNVAHSRHGSIHTRSGRQIFRETWRIQREFFYDEKMQGADWDAVLAKYCTRCSRT